MNKPVDTVATILITFVVTWILNTTVGYITADKGTVNVSHPIALDGKVFVVVTVENYSAEFLSGLALEVPLGVTATSMVSDNPIEIADSRATQLGPTRLVRLDRIAPGRLTRVFVPIPEAGSADTVRISNAKAVGLTVRREDELESPLRKAALAALFVSVLNAAFATLIIYLYRRDLRSHQEQLDSLSAKSDERREEIEKLRRSNDETRTRVAKQRLLLQARLFDYSKAPAATQSAPLVATQTAPPWPWGSDELEPVNSAQ